MKAGKRKRKAVKNPTYYALKYVVPPEPGHCFVGHPTHLWETRRGASDTRATLFGRDVTVVRVEIREVRK